MQELAHWLPVRRLALTAVLAVGAAAAALSACSSDEATTPEGSTDYVGLLASTEGQTGPLSITFASPVTLREGPAGPMASRAAAVEATGTLALGGSGPVAIAGTLGTDDALNMSGGGWALTGTLVSGKITGTFTGPGGENGSMSAISSSDASVARAYCGTYTGIDHTDETTDEGTFSFVVAGSSLLGTAVTDGGDRVDFSGTATGTSFTVHQAADGGFLNATGTYDATSTSGTYDTQLGTVVVSEGTFTGSDCAD